MQTTPTRILMPALALFGLMAALGQTMGQETTLIPFDATWKYFQGTASPGATWNASGFIDSTWPSGPGALGVEVDRSYYPSPIQTTLNLTQPGASAQTMTYYFRTHFNFVPTTPGVQLNFTTAVDDGAVVYLNGTEIFRTGGTITGTPAYATAASDHEATVYDPTIIANSSALRRGDNVLAVEVHQASATSSDIVFALKLTSNPGTALAITSEPEDQMAVIGFSLTNSVDVSGSNPVYQWYKDSVAVSGQTNADYVIAAAVAGNAGNYRVIAANGVNSVTSRVARVTVVEDRFGPELISALVGEGDTNRVFLNFNESIVGNYIPNPALSANNTNNYQIRIVGTNTTVPVIRAQTAGRQVLLTVNTNWDKNKEYYLNICNIMDTKTNLIRCTTQGSIGFNVSSNIVPFETVWSWNSAFGDSITNTWMKTNYVEDTSWSQSVSPFFNTEGLVTNCFGVWPGDGGTEVTIGYPAYLFRLKFVVPTNLPSSGSLRFDRVIDDGAIFYLNGTEIFRYNMPSGIPMFETPPSSSVDATNCLTNAIFYANFPAGTNLLAVELHTPQGETKLDMMFGCQIDGAFIKGPVIPELSVQKMVTPSRVVVSWANKGFTLETSTNATLATSWSSVTVASNATAYTNTTFSADKQRYYRLRR